MKTWIAALAVGVAAALARAADDPPKPNTLTPKEIEEGWILIFDGETTFGWTAEGDVKVAQGELCVGGDKAASVTTTSPFQRFDLRFEYQQPGKMRLVTISGTEDAKIVPAVDAWGKGQIKVDDHPKTGAWKRTTFEVKSPELKLMGDGRPVDPAAAAAPIRFEVPAGVTARLRSVKLRPLATRPIFNGKDLTGWKVFEDPKRNKSQWTVTKEGWLNVKNGPGDLQTAGKYGDFVLQLECISNGKALNSGVFFRCVEGQYQNGYEAQIQNGFKDNDRTKPSDFGTGAIYRRVAARKVIPNDNEWFTMTLVACGDHFATWVNGYPTVDWTDERKPAENPRVGFRSLGGHLSIQGHDPTTDLSFRNIRIAELKAEKKK